MIAGSLERLLREEIALKSKRRLAGEERQRVREREDDEVVGVICALQKCPAIIDDPVDPRVLVRMAWVELDTDRHQLRIDLDRIHRLRSVSKSSRDIVAVSGSDDQHTRRRTRKSLVDEIVVGVTSSRDGSLMRNTIRIDERGLLLVS